MKYRLSACFFLSGLFFAVIISKAQEQVSLEQAIALALEKNYDVLLAKNLSESASTDDNYAWGAYLPRLNATGAIVWNSNKQKYEFQDESRNTRGEAKSNNTSGSVQLVWTLFDGTKMFATRQRVSEFAEEGELLVKNQMVNTIAQVIANYYAVVWQKQQLKAIQEQIGVNEERVKLADRKLQVGTGGKPELLQAQVDLNEQRTQMVVEEATILQLKEQFNVLIGGQLPANYDVADTIIIDFTLKQEEIQNNIENSNFSLLAAKKNLNIANLERTEQKAELFPLLNFNAAYNYSKNNNITVINPFSSLRNENKGYNYGLSLTIPILNGFNTRRLIQQAQLNLDRQKLLYDYAKSSIDAGIHNAYLSYDNAKRILLVEEENILLAKENVFIALEGFKRGIITAIELRTAQQSLESAYTRLINARYEAKLAETELLRLSGDLLK